MKEAKRGKNAQKNKNSQTERKTVKEGKLLEREGKVDDSDQTFISCQLVLRCVRVCVCAVGLDSFRMVASISVCVRGAWVFSVSSHGGKYFLLAASC